MSVEHPRLEHHLTITDLRGRPFLLGSFCAAQVSDPEIPKPKRTRFLHVASPIGSWYPNISHPYEPTKQPMFVKIPFAFKWFCAVGTNHHWWSRQDTPSCKEGSRFLPEAFQGGKIQVGNLEPKNLRGEYQVKSRLFEQSINNNNQQQWYVC